MKNEDLFVMYRDISALFDDFLSCGRQNEIEQRGYDRSVFPVIIIVYRAYYRLSLIDGILQRGSGIMLPVV